MRFTGIASLCALAGFLLAGCATQAEVAAQMQAQAASDEAQCRSYGVMPGSPGYAQCRMNLENQHSAAFQKQQDLAAVGAYLISPH